MSYISYVWDKFPDETSPKLSYGMPVPEKKQPQQNAFVNQYI